MKTTRRTFMQTVAAAGATIAAANVLTSRKAVAAGEEPSEVAAAKDLPVIKCGMIGAGDEGRNLMNSSFKTDNAIIQFVAVADIWPYSRRYFSNVLKKFYKTQRYGLINASTDIKQYEDYKEMIAKEKLQAVFIASPDWVHAPQTVDCLNAGIHVYCEKEMSNTIEGAASMVKAQRANPTLMLQIGHQRRSNPRYQHALELIKGAEGKPGVLGRITNMMGQWNRSVRDPHGWPKGEDMDQATLARHGYESMHQFRNWRYFRKYSGGNIADLGSHQIDIFNWFLGSPPVACQATGGLDYYTNREWYDNIMTLLEYKTPAGPARAFYQVLNTTGYGGYYEVFMGTQGTMEISEDTKKGVLAREPGATKLEWENEADKVERQGLQAIQLKLGPSKNKVALEKIGGETEKPVHQLHIENFIQAILDKDPKKLTCNVDVGYETCASVLKINDAVASGKKIEYSKDDFHVA